MHSGLIYIALCTCWREKYIGMGLLVLIPSSPAWPATCFLLVPMQLLGTVSFCTLFIHLWITFLFVSLIYKYILIPAVVELKVAVNICGLLPSRTFLICNCPTKWLPKWRRAQKVQGNGGRSGSGSVMIVCEWPSFYNRSNSTTQGDYDKIALHTQIEPSKSFHTGISNIPGCNKQKNGNERSRSVFNWLEEPIAFLLSQTATIGYNKIVCFLRKDWHEWLSHFGCRPF